MNTLTLDRRIARALLLAALLLGGAIRPLLAQDANIETFAGILAAEDARRFDPVMLRLALAHPDSSVRSAAAQSIGRLREPLASRCCCRCCGTPTASRRRW